jgi:hypothetical protein
VEQNLKQNGLALVCLKAAQFFIFHFLLVPTISEQPVVEGRVVGSLSSESTRFFVGVAFRLAHTVAVSLSRPYRLYHLSYPGAFQLLTTHIDGNSNH